MRLARLTLAIALLVGLVMVAAPAASAAGNVVQMTIPVQAVETVDLGPEAACLGLNPGDDLTIAYWGQLHLTQFVGGPNAGRIHVRGQVEGTFAGDGVAGTFREHLNFKADSTGDGVFTLVIHASGSLADGTPIKFVFHVHEVVRDGEVRVEKLQVNCIKP